MDTALVDDAVTAVVETVSSQIMDNPAFVLPVGGGLASWALLGLREIGLLIENPFRRSLQLTQCTDALGREIDETLALHR